MSKAFIFDFDGVIVDSELYWDTHSFESYKAIIPAFTEEYNKQLKGRNLHDIYDMIVKDFAVDLPKEAYVAHIQTLTNDIYGKWCVPLPGLQELLEMLRIRKLPIAIGSSSERRWIEPTLKRLHLEGIFSPIVTAKDVGIGKPDPAIFLETARQLNVQPADCVVLEDSTNGVKAAKAAGMTCIGLVHDSGYVQDLSLADIRVKSMHDITDAMLTELGL